MKPFAVLLSAFATISAFAYEPDVTQERMEWDSSALQDRLVPSGSRMPEKTPLYYLAKFGSYPSFSDSFEWVVVLDKGKYLLTSWRVAKGKKDEDRSERVEFVSVELSREIAATVYTMWSTAILDARYSRAGGGLDGTSYLFSTWLRGVGWPSATTWSPSNNQPPRWMVEAGEAVLSYGRSKERNSQTLLTKLQEISDRIRKYQQVRVSSNSPNKSLERTRER